MDGYILTPGYSTVIEQDCNLDQKREPVYSDESMFFRLVSGGVLYSIKDKAYSVFNINKTN